MGRRIGTGKTVMEREKRGVGRRLESEGVKGVNENDMGRVLRGGCMTGMMAFSFSNTARLHIFVLQLFNNINNFICG